MKFATVPPDIYTRKVRWPKGIIKSTWHNYTKWLWLIAFIGSLNFIMRDAGDFQASPIHLGVIHKLIATVLVSALLIPAALRKSLKIFTGIPLALLIFAVFRIISFSWSIYPLWSVYRSFEYLIVIFLTTYCIRTLKNWKDLYDWANLNWRWIGVCLLSVYFGIIWFPGEAFQNIKWAALTVQLRGVIPRFHPTAISEFGAILTVIGIVRCLSYGWKLNRIMIITMGMITMILTQGRAGMLGAIVGMIVVLLALKKIKFGVLLCILGVFILFGLDFIKILVSFLMRGQTSEVFWDLSTRVIMWEEVLYQLFSGKWLIGYGAFAGGKLFAAEIADPHINLPDRITVDNAWLELGLNTGLIGIILFLVPIIWSWRTLWKCRKIPDIQVKVLAIEALSVLSVVIVRSLFVSTIILHTAFPFLYSIGCAEIMRVYLKKNCL